MNTPQILLVVPVLLAGALATGGCDGDSARAPATRPWLDPSRSAKMSADEVLDHYRNADPALDVDAALAQGDRRFICVMGFAETYPGVEDRAVVERYGSWVFPYVSDVVENRDLHDLAHGYAERYNRLLAERLTGGIPVKPAK